ncbi:MAG TPA: hypothetical protein VFT00_08375 [Nocardioides sp.]|nr:hypothetical protein [Nocardioides sp.]
MKPDHTARHTLRGMAGVSLAAVLALSGCSGGSDDPASTDSSSTSSPSSSSSAPTSEKPYLPVPDGVELTAQGSDLQVGDHAVVAYEPRQKQVGVLDIQVTRLEKTTFKESFAGWDIDDEKKKTNPYFVRATVKNVGDSDLGGLPVPLYIVDGNNRLVESSTFRSMFKPCPSTPLPDVFKAGDKAAVCLVFLSPDKGDLTAVSFRPTQEFDPITWTGELTSPKAEKPRKNRRKKG